MTERTLRWKKVGEDWALWSSSPLVRGSTVVVDNLAGKSTLVEVGRLLEDEDDFTYVVVSMEEV